MDQMEPGTIIAILTIVTPAAAMVLGALAPTILEGLAVLKAFDGMTRQPEAASDLRGSLIIVLALLESTAIYNLLVALVLLFANPVISSFLP
jgi:F-type H+-transporting ATPase subunit c